MSLGLFSYRQQPAAVKTLLAVHVTVYLAQWIAWGPVVDALALAPAQVVPGLRLWQPVTYIFLHAIGIFGFFFFLIHMYILSTLGRDLAQRWGSAAFALYYLGCGVAGAAVATALAPFAPAMMMGSATALLSLLAAFATLAPGAQVVFYFIPMTAQQLVWLIVILETLLAVGRLVPWVEVAAQLSGMGTGWFLIHRRVVGRDWGRAWREWREERRSTAQRERAVDMEQEVDRILDKVLRQGAGSLTRREQELMQKYSKSKR